MREEDFPRVTEEYTYFDSACMSLRPNQVIRKIEEYYREYPACPGRSGHKLGERADREIRGARESISELIDAPVENLASLPEPRSRSTLSQKGSISKG